MGEFPSTISRADIFRYLESNPAYLSVSPIHMGNIWEHQIDGELSFNLPGINRQLRVRATHVRPYSETHYTWNGKVIDDENQTIGHVIFGQKGNNRFGSIKLPNHHFLVRDLDKEQMAGQILIELDLTEKPGAYCGSGSENPTDDDSPENKPPPIVEPRNSCSTTISILFLYTEQVVNNGYDPIAIAEEGVATLNEALANSDIPNTNVQTKVAAVRLLENYEDDEDFAVDILSNVLLENPEVQQLRDQHHADLVLLLQKTDIYSFSDNNKDYNTVGYANINDAMNVDRVYAVVEVSSSDRAKVISHEVGHLLGCRHENGGHAYANGHVFHEPLILAQ